jgi:hypothetical protein
VTDQPPGTANPNPYYKRRLSDMILIAFHSACDQADIGIAWELLNALEFMMMRHPRLWTAKSAAAEKVWSRPMNDFGTYGIRSPRRDPDDDGARRVTRRRPSRPCSPTNRRRIVHRGENLSREGDTGVQHQYAGGPGLFKDRAGAAFL